MLTFTDQPDNDQHVRGDAFKTLFVARISFDTEPKDLEREFGRFGPIERIRIVTDTQADEKKLKKRKNRGYAFIVYEREKDMKGTVSSTFEFFFHTLLPFTSFVRAR